MIFFYLSGEKITAYIFVPAKNALCMGFKTQRVELTFADRNKRVIRMSGETVFGFFRQQIVTKVISVLQKTVYLLRQADRSARD